MSAREGPRWTWDVGLLLIDLRGSFVGLRGPFVDLKGPFFCPRNSCVCPKIPVRPERALLWSAIQLGPLSAQEGSLSVREGLCCSESDFLRSTV